MTFDRNFDQNIAVVLHRPGDLRVENYEPDLTVGPDDLLLRGAFCGLCGTDIHMWKTAELGDFVLKENRCLVLGHEASATVLKCGLNVTNFRRGDKVTMEPALPCLKCEFCKDGRYNMCEVCNRTVKGLPHINGWLQKVFVHPAAFTYKLPDNISLEEGAFVEPLACVVHPVTRAKIQVGNDVLVCGAGTIGLLTMLTARVYGAGRVVITDINEKRLQVAKELGADATVLVEKQDSADDVSIKVIQALGGTRPHITMECTGCEQSVQTAILATQNGGRVVIVGLGPELVSIPLVKASLREVDIIGSCRFKNNCFNVAIYLLGSGKVDVKPLITNMFTLENAMDAFNSMKAGVGIKTMVDLR